MGDTLYERVATLYGRFSAWRKVGQEVAAQAQERGIISDINGNADGYGVLANAIYRQAIDDSPTLRKALGLPPKVVPVPPCPECGQVHERLHTCADKLEAQRGRTRHRLCFEFDTGAELARVRAVVDSHEGGRTEWLKEMTEVDE